ncbi:MAG: hypothetical protein GPJ54_11715 [Candidatus Heimdallarchaeota archaeon]|nr:hypothetical protein [Candidatus Heimdallarchaeota archaeon]
MFVSVYSSSDLKGRAPKFTTEILELLQNQEALSPGQMKSLLPLIKMKNIRKVLRYLKNKGIILGKTSLLDTRRVIYRITTQDEHFEITKDFH